MATPLIELVRVPLAFIAGIMIGYGFGLMQNAALRRQEKLRPAAQADGRSQVIGSMRRVFFLLVALALVQLICPLLFVDGTQWWVSGGVLVGYGWILFWQLRRRVADTKRG